ncbi:MAG: hypothetical protein AAGC60_18635 [Acidobacteriota bacterium]
MVQKLTQGLFLTLLLTSLAFAAVTFTATPVEATHPIDCNRFHPPEGCSVQTIAVPGGFCCEFSGPGCTPSFLGPCWL